MRWARFGWVCGSDVSSLRDAVVAFCEENYQGDTGEWGQADIHLLL